MIRLVDQLAAPEEKLPLTTDQLEVKLHEESILPVQEPTIKNTLETQQSYEPNQEENIKPIIEPEQSYEPVLPKTPINQFMVEKISGILVPVDTVRIDGEVIAGWSDLYEGKQFTMVIIEALDGKKTTCKFKAIKETKNSAKGIIQIPEKILQTLQTEKGKLVMVKPVIE